MYFDLGKAQRKRMDADGTVWAHFSCPYCDDPSYHLGVGVTKKGKVVSKCLRCGRKLSSRTKFTMNGEVWEPDIINAKRYSKRMKPSQVCAARDVEDMPGTPLSRVIHLDGFYGKVAAELKRKWPALPFELLAEKGLRVSVVSEHDYVCPLWTVNGWGYILRRTAESADDGPKALNKGPKGVGFLREVNPGDTGPWVCVEGWFDACAVPPPYEPVILRGTSNWPDVTGEVYLALDADAAGLEGTKKIVRRCLKNGMSVKIAGIKNGKDPADLGPGGMMGALKDATEVSSMKEYIAWLSRR